MYTIIFYVALAIVVIVAMFSQVEDITNNAMLVARLDMDYPISAVREDSSVHVSPTYTDDD